MAAALGIAVGIWWTANTIAHHAIHRPFFRRAPANAVVDALLTVALGVPQALWRERHLAHHAGRAARIHPSRDLTLHVALVLAVWTILALRAPAFFALAYLPGYAGALVLCAVHGHYEHAAGTTSHYGRLYNRLCFNDGYHAEHHRFPGVHWSRLPAYRPAAVRGSPWPAPLRWVEAIGRGTLALLERIVLRSRALQRFVLDRHAAAFAAFAGDLRDVRSAVIVGGGLFPRTALVLDSLLPSARLLIVDASRANLERARALVDGERVALVHGRFDPVARVDCDLVVVPLAFDGDRAAVYADPPAPIVIVHDWIWRRRGSSRIVSPWLLKRLNLVRR